MSRIVKSAAGDPIEIFVDEDWLKLTDAKEHALRMWDARGPVFQALWTHGEYANDSGEATQALWTDARRFGYKASQQGVISLFMNSVFSQCIEREIRGRRTFSIKLVAMPENWHSKLMKDMEKNRPVPAKPAPIKDVEVEEEPLSVRTGLDEPAPAVDNDLHMANMVATSLLNQVVELIQTGPTADAERRIEYVNAQLKDTQQKLGARLEENEQLRKKFRELSDEMHAMRTERDGLRQRLRQAEDNLQRAIKPDTTRTINDRIQSELTRLMQQTPTQKGE